MDNAKDKNVGNIGVKIKGNILTLTIDLSKDLGLSSKKKSTLVATTHGIVPLDVPSMEDQDHGMAINVFRRPKRAAAPAEAAAAGAAE
jgi:hypothetical protein